MNRVLAPAPRAGDYRLALADFFVASATMEHILHDAIVHCFQGREWMADHLIRDQPVSQLIRHFEKFYPESKNIHDLCIRIRDLMELRNTFAHGLPSWIYNDGSWKNHLENRRKPRVPMPTLEELQAASRDLAGLNDDVLRMSRTRPADYLPPPPDGARYPIV